MVKQIIPAYSSHIGQFSGGSEYLNISEFYYDTVQGEGIYTGHPAAFLRLQGCSLSCSYCDSKEIWKIGNPYTFNELFELINSTMLISKLKEGQHLVLTGGSPLLQQDTLIVFLNHFQSNYGFYPFVEVENECVIMPDPAFIPLVDCWNNSPKLQSSGIKLTKRRKPEILIELSSLSNSWFKFVISSKSDWNEIDACFLVPQLIKKEQIILMPEGATREELEKSRMITVEMAVEHGVRYSDRLHIQLWNKKTGV